GISNLGKMTISGCTISKNEIAYGFEGFGAGIKNFATGVMQIENSTISENHFNGETGYGGGVSNAGSLDIRFSTITNNKACYGWGIHNEGPHFALYDTIVAGNAPDTPSCSGQPELLGGYTGSANLIGGDPMLEPLHYNGGHTQTHAVLPGS